MLYSHEDGTKVVRLLRKEACYCRFAPADEDGRIPQILYANWRKCVCSRENIEVIELLDPTSPWRDLQRKLAMPENIVNSLSSVVCRLLTLLIIHSSLCRYFSRQMVQHQAAYRHR